MPGWQKKSHKPQTSTASDHSFICGGDAVKPFSRYQSHLINRRGDEEEEGWSSRHLSLILTGAATGCPWRLAETREFVLSSQLEAVHSLQFFLSLPEGLEENLKIKAGQWASSFHSLRDENPISSAPSSDQLAPHTHILSFSHIPLMLSGSCFVCGKEAE